MNKYAKKLPKDDLKKFAKEVNKKLVASDFKHGRVEDPTKISEKQEKKVKKYVKEFFDKVVEKKAILDKKKQAKDAAAGASASLSVQVNGNGQSTQERGTGAEDDLVDLTPDSPAAEVAASPSVPPTPFDVESPGLKRKRTGEDTPGDDSETKRLKDEPSPPPPPPPPPADTDMHDLENGKEETEEEKEMRLQEEELQRENEEAMKMDLDGSLKKEEIESAKTHNHSAFATNGHALARGTACGPHKQDRSQARDSC